MYEHNLDDGTDEGTDSFARVKDTHVYSLLFTECDSDQSGWANVDSLISFIKKVLSGSSEAHSSADETVDSDGSVSVTTNA